MTSWLLNVTKLRGSNAYEQWTVLTRKESDSMVEPKGSTRISHREDLEEHIDKETFRKLGNSTYWE